MLSGIGWAASPLFTCAVLAVALVTDRLIGDPPRLWRLIPHPVAIIGRAIAALDARLNRPELPTTGRRRRGIAALALLAIAALGIGAALEAILATLPLGLAIEAVIVSVFLAHRSLIDHVAAVETALRVEGLEAGRRAVARIVGRDVTVLDAPGVARAAAESAAENFSDGLVAPAFWFLLLGLPGLLLYKTVNTADSMIGHRSPRYAAFGWASARADDLLNLAPARLAALLIAAVAPVSGGSAAKAFAAARRDAPKHKSPNAGWPEAALAGALGLAFGGPRRYGDVAVDGAWLNADGRKDAQPADIARSIRLIDHAWTLLTGLVAIAALISFAIGR